jgi:DNA invertase Pin-like site-specific DNA recombinase
VIRSNGDNPVKRFVAYYRVSTDKQGKSGLGLEAQQQAVKIHLEQVHGQLIAEYTEVESGAQKSRPELSSALLECRRKKGTLIIAKLDRLARNVHVISGLMESGVDFVAADNPHANKLMLHLLAAFAEHEREQISARTKSALAAAKLRGITLGRTGRTRAEANQRAAQRFAEEVKPALLKLVSQGINGLSPLANALNAAGIPTYRQKTWHPATVSRVLARIRS